MVKALPQRYEISSGEVRNLAIDLTQLLDTGETLSGTPTLTEQTTSDLTFAAVAVNTATLSILDDAGVAIGAAVEARVSGGVAGREYEIHLAVGTTATQTLKRALKIDCR